MFRVKRQTFLVALLGCAIGIAISNIPRAFVSLELAYLDILLRNPRPDPVMDYDIRYSNEVDLIQFMEWHGAGQTVCRHLISHINDSVQASRGGYSRGGAFLLPFQLRNENIVAAIPELDKILQDPTSTPEQLRDAASIKRHVVIRLTEAKVGGFNEKLKLGVAEK